MSKLTLRKWPDKILTQVCAPVTDFDEIDLSQIIIDMFLIMKVNNGVGLAANQVGLTKRILIYRTDLKDNYMINPEILLQSEERQRMQEGCLSFPGLQVEVGRATSVKIRYQDVEGNLRIEQFVDFPAQCIQHEIEHLEGKTFISSLSSLKRDQVTRKMKKWRKRDERNAALLAAQRLREPLMGS